MKRLSIDDVSACRELARNFAEEHVDFHIRFHNKNAKLSPAQLIGLIFDDFTAFAEGAVNVLVASEFMDRPGDYSGFGHENLLAFRVFTDEYERWMGVLINERHRLYLNVPFADKNEAKGLGAFWDQKVKKWYVPHGVNAKPFERWFVVERNKLKETKAGFRSHVSLYVDLVPSSAWFSNLRSELKKEEWDSVKRATFRSANYRCQSCGGVGPNHPVECHERWNFDVDSKVQTLIGTISFCPSCHEATHFGLARVRGRDGIAFEHLMRVNKWSESEAREHIALAMEEWKWRSTIRWKLDARWLLDFVPLSAETQKKIIDHADGIGERTVDCWQKEVISNALQK